jgi:EmrB/QacA subfamily drug resistance transporter
VTTKPGASTTQRWVLGLASVASLMITLDALVVTTALNTIRTSLGASVEALEWTVNAYTLSFAVLMMTGAALGERLGRRRIFIAGLSLFTTATAACARASDIAWLIAARAVQGAGGAMITPLAMSLVSSAFPPQQRAKAMGIFTGVMGLGILGGPVVGGAISQALSWEWIFWLNVPIGLILIPLIRIRIEESERQPARLDLGGVVLVTAAALGLVWGLVRGNTSGWASAEVVSSLIGGVVLTAAFVAWEQRFRAPMLPMGLFRDRTFRASNASGFFLFASNFSSLFLLAQYFQTALGYSPLDAGLRMLPWTATVFAVAPAAGSMVARVGARRLMVGGMLMQAGGMGAIALLVSSGAPYPALIAPLVIAGSGISTAMPASQNAVVSAVPPDAIGKASGAYNTLRQLGGVFGVATVVSVFAGTGSYATVASFTDGFIPAIGVSSALSVAAALAGLAMPRRQRRSTMVEMAPSAAAVPEPVRT